MQIYNLLSGAGFDHGIFGGWSMAIGGLGILAFLILICKGQAEDGNLGDFNFIWAMVGGLLFNFILITLTGSALWAFIVGIIGAAIGGWGSGYILGGTGSSE